MKRKRVLIIEDEQLQRETLRQALEWRGFDVESAAGAQEARYIVARQKEPFDVLVLDMHLKDDPDLTGADLGIEFRRQYWQQWAPEFLINSAYTRSEYMKLALELGAAAYLEKKDAGIETVIQHVRALALRHGLSVEHEDALERIQSIAAGSRNQGEAILRFCRKVLAEELVSCLGTPFLILITIGPRTFGWSSTPALSKGEWPEYKTIQALSYGKSKGTEPFVLDQEWFDGLGLSKRSDLAPLTNAVFLPLTIDGDFRLSLGLLPQPDGLDQDLQGFAEVLARYFQPAVLKHLLTLLAILTEMRARQMAVLKTTSQFCLYLGQEQLTTLEAATDAGEITEPGMYVRKMQSFAEDLCRTGEVLGELAESQEPSGGQEESWKQKSPVSMRDTIDRAWHKVSRTLGQSGQDILTLGEGDCIVLGRPSYLEIAASRILQWFLMRVIETPPEVDPKISIRFVESPDGSRIFFEDRSRRLDDHLRQFLFVPLSQAVSRPPARDDLEGPGVHTPLYVAKTVVEFGNGGRLEDQSTELGGTLGHRLVMSFPEVNAA